MMDQFALLNFPRVPWLPADDVKARFLELSAPWHPDRVHGKSADEIAEANQKFAALNAAAACLREPQARLQHLLQLETGAASAATQNIPANLIELFGKIGQTCRSVDQFLAERGRATSPMIQAQLFAQGLDWSDKIGSLQSEVAALKANGEEQLKKLNAKWPTEKPMEELRGLAHQFATIGRWEKQLQERFAALAAF